MTTERLSNQQKYRDLGVISKKNGAGTCVPAPAPAVKDRGPDLAKA